MISEICKKYASYIAVKKEKNGDTYYFIKDHAPADFRRFMECVLSSRLYDEFSYHTLLRLLIEFARRNFKSLDDLNNSLDNICNSLVQSNKVFLAEWFADYSEAWQFCESALIKYKPHLTTYKPQAFFKLMQKAQFLAIKSIAEKIVFQLELDISNAKKEV